MRIAMISDCYPPHMGGIESQVAGLATRLGGVGHTIEVVTASPGPARKRGGMGAGVHVTRAALPLPGFVPVNPFAGPTLAAALRRADVAHIHMGVVSPLALQALARVKRHRCPCVVTFHCMLDGWKTVFRTTGLYGKLPDHIVLSAVSTTLAAQVCEVAGGAHVDVIPNGVELSRWRHIAACRPTPPSPNRPLHLVTALRFMPRKRPLALVAIMARLRARLGEDCPRLTMYGEGAQLRAVRGAIRAARLGDVVTCPGRLDEAGLQMAYLGADAFVLASTHESFGIAALEARAAGLPVLARAGTGITDFITDGTDGILAHSDRELARVIEALVRDEQRVIGLQAAAQERVSLSWKASIDAAQSAYARAGARG
ncbi:glycosyltransferase family 4 protein [Nanchangia anserum]|uniref:Glycosyltransferase family 4 protein n=1 Tax=Nanchangia anserum TaxID=2692125 RepID=A0A8I0GBD0_9ACTO|nr:glycosyltransferase family 4 protein [Nanchangia anserum]MBD3688901.1 glycosyltransferase family 4 protein [Nanchangia anserum]QOX81165.1 glycosyltransferase family 4 protein [Nanchangia anserum]